MDMPLDSRHNKQLSTSSNTKVDGVESKSFNPEQVQAGSSKVMTHKQMQAHLKNSELGKLLGVSHLLD